MAEFMKVRYASGSCRAGGIDSLSSVYRPRRMHSLLKADSRDEVWRRAMALRPDTPARWGSFTAPRMLAHLIQSLHMMSGDLAIPPEPAPWLLSHAPLKHLLIYVLPFPKGMSTFPELLARPSPEPQLVTDSGWADEQRAFQEALNAVGTKDAEGKWPDHGAFGPLTGREWGVLQYRHLDHHLRQFGV